MYRESTCAAPRALAMNDAFNLLDAGPELARTLAEPRERFERRIRRVKAKEYPRRPPEGWTKANVAESNLLEWLTASIRDTIPRIESHTMSEAEFADVYERGSKPVVIRGLLTSWPAVSESRWSVESLLREHGDDRFKVGEDDEGYAVYVKLKYFLRYMLETKDDSPLYIFDSSFAEREATRKMRHDWELPKFFTDDLFKLVGERRRPPYRWFVLGPERSGSYIHIDPLGTSAWNALLAGRKCWACFRPGVPKEVVQPPKHPGGREAVAWFAHVYPTLIDAADPDHRPLTVIQQPGETMFVPGGWWHVVLNLDAALAVTQNFCSRTNFEAVWAKTRKSRPKMARKLQECLRTVEPELYRKSLIEPAEITAGDSSSSSSSSSSSTSSSVSDLSDADDADGREHRATPVESDRAGRRRHRSRSPERRRSRSRSCSPLRRADGTRQSRSQPRLHKVDEQMH